MAKQAPDGVSSLSAPKRESTSKFSTKWSRPSSANSGDKAYDGITVHWQGVTSTYKEQQKGKGKKWVSDGAKKIADHNLNKGSSSDTLTIDRKSFYPLKQRRLNKIQVAVESKNNCGSKTSGWKVLTFEKPQKPSITIDYDDTSGLVTIEISCPTSDKKDRYSCSYHVYRTDKGGSSSYYKNGKKIIALDRDNKPLSDTVVNKNSFKRYHNVQRVYLVDGGSITITVEATSKGFAGDSETATKSLTITSPLRPQITEIDLSNKDTLSLVRNLAAKQFNNGAVRVFYKSAEGAPTANYDNEHPDVYTLERAVTPWKVNTVTKADLYPDWTTDIDSNAGSTSESSTKYVLTRQRYSDFKYQKKAKVQYYTAYDKKLKKRTATFPAWKVDAYKAAKYTVAGKKVARYKDIKKKKKAKIKIFKAYDKKAKKTVKNIPAYEYQKYKKAKFKNAKGKNVLRYKNFAKTGTALVKYYKAKDEKTGKMKTNIPVWKLDTYKKATYKAKKSHSTALNPSDAVMGEPIANVFRDMGFAVNGGVWDKRVWYRIKVERFGIPEYSQAFEAVEFRAPAPTISQDYSGFMRIAQNPKNPGTSILGTVGWNNADKKDEGVDNPNWKTAVWTTLVEWSEYAQAHHSNQEPSNIEIDWHNSANVHKIRRLEYNKAVKAGTFSTRKGGKTLDTPIKWKSSADFAIYGLEPGVPIYLWTRRHMVLGEFDLLGPISSAPTSPKGFFPFTPIDNPTQVAVYLPEYYVYGEDLTISWGHNAYCEQKSWTIYAFPAEDLSTYTAGTTNVSSIPKKILASGTGKKTTTIIPGGVLTGIMGKNACVASNNKVFSIIKHLGITVGVSTGGTEILSIADSKKKWVDTDPMTIIHQPTCGLYALGEFNIESTRRIFVFTNTLGVYGIVNIYATNDTTLYLPDREWHQADGECVWNTRAEVTDFVTVASIFDDKVNKVASLQPIANQYKYVAVVDIPASTKSLFDGETYRIEAYTVNPDAQQYKSDTQIREVVCNYLHKASVPGRYSRIEADDKGSYLHNLLYDGSTLSKSVDEEMTLPPTAYIYCAKPDALYSATDRCRVYRVTPDGAEIIADDVEFESIVVDHYAPFSKFADTRYIIATVTVSGNIATREIRYNMRRHGMRFDWGDPQHPYNVELPFDIELNASYDKNVRIDNYVDGTTQAHFNQGSTKTESVSTKLVRLKNPYQFELVRRLGQYPGTAFFRAHDGSAYECVVRVSGLANNYSDQTSPVSLELTRVTTSDRFKPSQGEIVKSL